jgi:hypothetical protein
VASLVGDNLVELCNLHVSKIWSDSDKRGGRWWEWPYKRATTVLSKIPLWVVVGLWCLTPLSTIFHLYHWHTITWRRLLYDKTNLLLLSIYNKSLLNNTIFVFIYLSCNSWKTLGLLKTKNDIHFFHTWGLKLRAFLEMTIGWGHEVWN